MTKRQEPPGTNFKIFSDRITDYLPRPYCVSKGLRKNSKFVPSGFCLLVKVFLEFKNELGFFLPLPEHEIPKLA